jgi:hypothetical protein
MESIDINEKFDEPFIEYEMISPSALKFTKEYGLPLTCFFTEGGSNYVDETRFYCFAMFCVEVFGPIVR